MIDSTDNHLRQILTQTQTIAVVGHSDRPDRPSYQIAHFLRQAGYRVYPVNPALNVIENQPCYPTLKAVPEAIDLVNVFRRSEFLPEVVQEAIEIGAKTVWAQSGISNPVAAQMAADHGLTCLMNACIKIEYLRLGLSGRSR
ncbi:CoA-binding protein [Leptolyngbya sp. FACHB-711]|uniref:CoA-binding protein n=1 Tax=unclassified Leptolyngbya TaxID=2650499 RepID=UPI001684538B|nr:CoA-binding protein [Leptolyngbya sp. FACHB-711]MBD1852029.1 CoA-binding protein [Cyanobacteria bacterium FACHB-502]MBD2023896.1 CoA-binding protein [Leptolyngbya sp. FACHB-711]